jgi:hypothetical protein
MYVFTEWPQWFYHLMTDPYAEDNLEPICPQPTCKHEECQVLYGKYKVIYEKYYKNLERVHTLTHENQLLSCDVKHKVALLELDKEQLGLMIEQEKQVSDILQHKAPVSVQSVHGGEHPVCDGCVHHRQALIQHRSNNAKNYTNVKAIQDKNQSIVDSYKKELDAALLINGRLRVKMGQNIDPFWKDKETLQLRGELSQCKEMYEASKRNANSLKAELEKCKAQVLILKKDRDVLENELSESRMVTKDKALEAGSEDRGRMSGTKRKLMEEADESEAQAIEEGKSKKPLTATMNAALEYRLGLVFFIDPGHACENEENLLYDTFRESVDSEDLERCFESIYKACHPEDQFSSRDRRLLKEGGVRVCKGPFGACLKAFGGESKKRGTQTIWTNITIKKK